MWLQCVDRQNGFLQGKVMKRDGDVEWRDLDSTWDVDTPVARGSKMSGTTCFSRWKLVDASEYLADMKIEISKGEDRHQVFAVDLNGLSLVVPAILVLKALFKPNATVFEYLFRPSGLDMLLAPKDSNGSTSVALLPQRMRQHVPVRDTSFERLRWLYCFPSARAAFDSVYTYAASGTVGVKLPKAQVDISLQGRLLGKKFLVAVLNISACTPLEEPFDWAGWQPESFRLKTQPPSVQLNPILASSDILEGAAGWALSDMEWARVEHLFPAGTRLTTGNRAREFIGAILTKLGTGVGWAWANSRFGTTAGVSSFYQNCRKSGRWDKVMTIVMETRRQSVLLA
jgi:hypothetical protein